MQRTKEEILKEIRERRGDISKEELLAALDEKKEETKKPARSSSKQKLISSVSYVIGSIIVLLGVLLLFSEFWDVMGSVFRIGVTFGIGFLVFALVIFLETNLWGPRILKEPLSILSGILVFSGSFIAFNELTTIDITPGVYLTIFSILAVMFASLYSIRNSSVYLFFIISFVTGIFYSAISVKAIQERLLKIMQHPEAVYAYLTSLIGVSYLYLAYFLKRKGISSLLYLVGVLALIRPLFLLVEIYSAPAWNIVAALFIIALAFAARYLKSMALYVAGLIVLFGSIFTLISGEVTSGIIWSLLSVIAIVVFFILFVVLKKRKLTSFPCLTLIAGSLTLLPYTILAINPIQDIINRLENPYSVYMLLTSIIGLVYISIGYFFREKFNFYESFSKLLYFIGPLVLTVPMFFLADIFTGVWDLIAVIFIFGVISLGIYLQEKNLIFSGGGLLAIHIIVISYRYFVDTIGWPITLIIVGFLLVGIGYFSFLLSKKVEEK